MKQDKNQATHILQPPLHINEDEYKKSNMSGMNVQETLSEYFQKPPFSTAMDILNFILTISITMAYVWRTHDMCFFDSDPIWREIDPDAGGPVGDCNGEAQEIYYISLVVIHFYLLFEFILRVLMEKYQLKFLTSLESIVEIFTTVPFLVFYFSFERSSYIVQLFIMLD